jgi:hypothetical protein
VGPTRRPAQVNADSQHVRRCSRGCLQVAFPLHAVVIPFPSCHFSLKLLLPLNILVYRVWQQKTTWSLNKYKPVSTQTNKNKWEKLTLFHKAYAHTRIFNNTLAGSHQSFLISELNYRNWSLLRSGGFTLPAGTAVPNGLKAGWAPKTGLNAAERNETYTRHRIPLPSVKQNNCTD